MSSFFDITKFKDPDLSDENTEEENENESVDLEEKNVQSKEQINDTSIRNQNIIHNIIDDANNSKSNTSISDDSYNDENNYQNQNKNLKNDDSITTSLNHIQNTIIKDAEKNIVYAEEDNIDTSEFNLIENLAIKFPFELDDFQKRSIIRLEQRKSVLVCAHTSSGKTVVAEYGIALGRKHSKRVIYTSPIKALSNQKYQDFKKRFDNVGILTGDVSINPDAQCLIMTTEILQGYLYKNHEILSQLEWIIFDEIHYINDIERGHVWEEILILLPPGINLIMLSATIPNYMEFAKWVGNIKKTTIYIEITLKRIVPLRHQIYIDSQNIFEVKSIDGKVHDNKVREAIKYLKDINTGEYMKVNYKNIKANEMQIRNTINYFAKEKEGYYKNQMNSFNSNYDPNKLRVTRMHHKLMEMVEFLDKNKLCPAVIFVFNIKKITEYTRMLRIKNLLSDSEKNKVITFFKEVISSKISKEDQEIPQIKETFEILKTGIGLHHAGLLPILKEIIEILYSQGLIKILFATTSFSIGLNMPTKTVVFTEIYKFNIDKKEILTSSEYLQMCGRAGRRGKDPMGNIFIILTDQTSKLEDDEIIKMLKDEGTNVQSKFRLSYKTILSYSSRDKKGIQAFVQLSFLESEKSFLIPEKHKELIEKKKELKNLQFKCKYDKDDINKSNENISKEIPFILYNINNKKEKNLEKFEKNNALDIEDFPCRYYYILEKKYSECNKTIFADEDFSKKIFKLKFGKILKIKEKNKHYQNINHGIYVMLIQVYKYYDDFGLQEKLWCLWIKEYNNYLINDNTDDEDELTLNDLENEENWKKIDEKIFKEKNEYRGFKYQYIICDIEDIINIYDTPYIKQIRESIIKRDGKLYFNHKKIFEEKILKELYYQIKDYFIDKNSVPNKLNYDYSNYIINITQKNALNQRRQIKEAAKSCLCIYCPKFKSHINKYYQIKNTQNKIEEISKEISPERMSNYEEFIKREEILKELKYINEKNDILTQKGNAAREINTTDCVIISEILLSDILTSLKDDELVAFLSCFATNRSKIEMKYPEINDNLSTAFNKFFKIYDKILNIEKSKKDFEENIYNRRFLPEAVLAIKGWMNGEPFGEICKMTDLEEGKLYNLISRIYLFFEEIINFYTVLGIVKEGQRFENIKKNILRGIMGVQSLYLQDNINFDINK